MAQSPPAEEARTAAPVDFSTDRDDELPVGLQLVWRIRGMVAAGTLRPGDRLPSVRELADFSRVNVNTARTVYSSLEREGLLSSQHGRGTFVADSARIAPGLADVVVRARAEAAALGASPDELLAALYASAAEATPPPPATDPAGDEASLRRSLREQIAHLERELAAYAWDDRRDPAAGKPPRPHPAGAVADAETLERTRAGLIERLARLRAEAAGRGDAEQAARRRRAALIDDPGSHPWEVVSAGEAGETGGGEWQVVPRFGPLGAIMGWWRVRATGEPGGGDGPSRG